MKCRKGEVRNYIADKERCVVCRGARIVQSSRIFELKNLKNNLHLNYVKLVVLIVTLFQDGGGGNAHRGARGHVHV